MAKTNTTWGRLSRFEKLLLLATAILVIIIAIIVITHKVSSNEESQPPSKEHGSDNSESVCRTRGCNATSTLILSKMNTDVDPCEDFYEFSCGTWIKNYEFEEGFVGMDAILLVDEQVKKELRIALEMPVKEDEPRSLQNTKTFYKACLNEDAIEKRGLKDLNEIIDSMGGWPVVKQESWNEDEFSLEKTTYHFYNHGLDSNQIFFFYIDTNPGNSTYRSIQADQPNFHEMAQRDELLKGFNSTLIKGYYEYMVDVATIFGADRKRAEEELLESLEFERQLANISLPSENRLDAAKLYNVFTIKELEEKYPFVPWLEYSKAFVPKDIEITEDEPIIVKVPQFFTDLETLLAGTSNRTLANYLVWRAVADVVPYLNKEIQDAEFKLSNLFGKKHKFPRWKQCIMHTLSYLPQLTSALYVKEYFQGEQNKAIQDIVDNVLEVFIGNLKTVDWMDDETRSKALEKVRVSTQHIGYPVELKNYTLLNEQFKKIEVDEDRFLSSVLSVLVDANEYNAGLLRKPVNKTDWYTHSKVAQASASYNNIENSIVLTAAIIHNPMFNVDRPKYMNYGGIGSILGHEITHGFDQTGKGYDKDGNVQDWWSPEAKKTFHEKAQCIVDQYNNYLVKEVGVKTNGLKSQNENIADNGGLKHGYLAYEAWLKKNSPEERLPGLDYTPKQMYFIAYAQNWCAKYKPEILKYSVENGIYSTGRYRTIGPLHNSEVFAREFGCHKNSRMNPAKKCKVW